ncbi:hypothetical protein CRG98_001023 [Punica granatum]|uniref:Uncharacterized protein n=1 Tax=Punica granatum TaxID=22663 RepID=A0A2I0LEJ4_PUNGR|nr:hypothetical protein CRG98_001023 [Punica granatum]
MGCNIKVFNEYADSREYVLRSRGGHYLTIKWGKVSTRNWDNNRRLSSLPSRRLCTLWCRPIRVSASVPGLPGPSSPSAAALVLRPAGLIDERMLIDQLHYLNYQTMQHWNPRLCSCKAKSAALVHVL